jgi:diaminopropionate ammonia-lyase
MMTTIESCGLRYVLAAPVAKLPPADFTAAHARQALRFHRTLPGYEPTGLVNLSHLAGRWNIGNVLVKDESTRFGLNAFKVLGGSYAVARMLCQRMGIEWEQVDFGTLKEELVRRKIGPLTLATATDGNHGRSVAWMAEQLGLNAVIYMPKGTVRSRVESIRRHGAIVEVTGLNYDETVRLVWDLAGKNGWQVIQDTAWEGYTQIPRWIMQGYTTMSIEAVEQMTAAGMRPTHVFVQAGVGAFAAAMVGHMANVFSNSSPRFIVVEPIQAACMLASARAGDSLPRGVKGDLDTIMAGLACGEPSTLAWEILREWSCCFIGCDDFVAANGMRILANPIGEDAAVESGESGAVGIGLLDQLANHPDGAVLRRELEIDSESTVLVFNTEGATDPVNYRDVVWYGKYGGLWDR